MLCFKGTRQKSKSSINKNVKMDAYQCHTRKDKIQNDCVQRDIYVTPTEEKRQNQLV